MHTRIALFLLLTGPTALAALAPAHHGRGGACDMKRQLSLEGTVAEVFWRNRHIVIFGEAPDEGGRVVRWTIEHSDITTLAQRGYGRATLRAGQEVTAVVD